VIDEGFLGRVYKVSICLCLWIAAWLAISGGAGYLFGLFSGSAIGLLSLWSLDRMAQALSPTSSSRKTYWKILLLTLFKYAGLAVILLLLFSTPYMNLGAFLVGVSMPLSVIVLKVIGQMLTPSQKGASRG
jgi:hypothetical protein